MKVYYKIVVTPAAVVVDVVDAWQTHSARSLPCFAWNPESRYSAANVIVVLLVCHGGHAGYFCVGSVAVVFVVKVVVAVVVWP